MKPLALVFSILTMSTITYAGTPDQDQRIRALREKFKSATSLERSDLRLLEKWKCTSYDATRGDFNSKKWDLEMSERSGNYLDYYTSDDGWFKPEYAYLDKDPNGITVLKTQAVSSSKVTYKIYYRKYGNKLIGEFIANVDASNAYESISVPGADVASYDLCEPESSEEVNI